MTGSRPAVLLAAVAVGAGGCATSEDPAMPRACVEGGPRSVERALSGAPGAVRLGDGTALSRCVERATSEADLQTLGLVLTTVAENLEERAPHDAASALRLGYLVGAARRRTGDAALQAELVRRLERSAALDGAPAATRREVDRGMRAGEARG